METIPITEAKARIAELADRVARQHDHFTITRNGRADVMLISVAEYESLQETLDLLSDDEERRSRARAREDLEHGRRPRRVWTVVERQRNATATGPGRDRPRQPQAGRRSGHDGRQQVTDHEKMIEARAKIVDL